MALSLGYRIFLLGICLVYTDPTHACSTIVDPCLANNYTPFPQQINRCPTCGGGNYCDKFNMQRDTWYRFDYNITTTTVVPESCGTHYPIWMNGTIPGESEGIVDRSTCLVTFTSHCQKIFNMKMKTCASHYVYCWTQLPTACAQRFCFESPPLTTTLPTTTEDESRESDHGDDDMGVPDIPRKTKDCSKQKAVAVVIAVSICTVIFAIVLVAVARYFRRSFRDAGSLSPQVFHSQPANVRMNTDFIAGYKSKEKLDILEVNVKPFSDVYFK